MSEPNSNGSTPPNTGSPLDKESDTTAVSFDHYYEFEENESQPASAPPWPEPPFVAETPKSQPKS